MNIPILAVGRVAALPFHLERLILRIWSVEELCHLFKTNPFILDETILDRRLVAWLESECDLPELAGKLSLLLKKNGGVEAFVNTIIEYTGFLTAEEIERVNNVLHGNADLTDYEMEINRADFLLSCGKYQLAWREYERILSLLPQGAGEFLLPSRSLLSRVLHNKGIALARLFMFKQAAASFLLAYERGGAVESGRAYLIATRLGMSDVEYISFIAERPIFRDFSLEVEHIYIQAANDYNGTEEKRNLDDLIFDPGISDGSDRRRAIDQLVAAARHTYNTSQSTYTESSK
ncbi:MAG: hypothetical protein LBC96_05600 [Lachnospiraceae bacterium]|jgi:tetratricopeptide (TPR) repeat protein|nr:hypothetical protein [Lachnospiraceae bacterium]